MRPRSESGGWSGGRLGRVGRVRGRVSDGGQTGVRRLVRRGSDGSKWLVLNGSVRFGRLFACFFIFFFAELELNAKARRSAKAQAGRRAGARRSLFPARAEAWSVTRQAAQEDSLPRPL